MRTSTDILRTAVAVLCAIASLTSCQADDDKPISYSELPTAAQTLIQTYFQGKTIALTTVESGVISKSYDVVFASGEKIEFDRKGNWTEISCKGSSVPTDLIPSAVLEYVERIYPDQCIVSIEKDQGETEIELSNRVEITFNKKYQVIDID